MEDSRKEQVEALETMKDYNIKLVKALKEVTVELKGEKKEDTDEYLDYILRGVNWELQVINGTLPLLNEKEEKVSKESLNGMVQKINNAYMDKDSALLAEVMDGTLVPFFEELGTIVAEVVE